MATTAVEREVKLDVAEDWALPDLAGVKGVAEVRDEGEHRLVATYLDTADHRLLAARATLRRRTGGSDAGWHLKLPLADARLEVRRENRRPPRAVPADLVTLVRSRARAADLVPVMELVTRRHVWHLLDAEGVVLVEVVEDHVVATDPTGTREPQAWREVEVELVDGPRVALEKTVQALLRSGARLAAGPSKLGRALGAPASARAAVAKPSSADGLLLRYLRTHVDALVDADTRVRLGHAESVHDLRVATRRVRSALATHHRRLPAEGVAALRAGLATLAGVTGAARDAEVLEAHLLAAAAALPAGEGIAGEALATRLATTLAAETARSRVALVEALDAPEHVALLDDLAALVAGSTLPRPAAGSGAAAARGRRASVRHELRRTRRALRTARAAAGTPAADAALHEARKAAKRARYAAELVAPAVGARAQRTAAALADLQDVLGAHQDAVVARARVRDLAHAAHAAGEDTVGYGVLHERLRGSDPTLAARRAFRTARRAWGR